MSLDIAHLAPFFGFDAPNLNNLFAQAPADLLTSFVRAASSKAKDFETLKAEKLQVDVELENAVRTADTKVKAQKAAVTRQAKEIEELRKKYNEVDTARETLVTQLSSLQSNASDSNAETLQLRSRIATLESSNRDILALSERRSAEKDNAYKELEEQHKKVVELRREVNKLEDQRLSLENTTAAQKFKEQSLKQELDFTKSKCDRQAEDLNNKASEYTKFRKERNAQLNTLQRQYEDATAAADALRQTETTLRRRLEELQVKTEEAYEKNAALQEEVAKTEQSYKTQLASSKRLADLQAEAAATHKARCEDLAASLEVVRDDAAGEIGRLQVELETERADKLQAEKVIAELELRIEKQERQPQSVPGTPARNGIPGSPAPFGSAQKAMRNLSQTQIYTQYVEAKQELEIEQRRTEKLQSAIDQLLQEMESRVPELTELQQELEQSNTECLESGQRLVEAYEARDVAVHESQHWQSQHAVKEQEIETLQQQLRDSAVQLKILLVEIQSRDRGLEAMSAQERLDIERAARGELDGNTIEYHNTTQRLISERLVIFRSVDELQTQNEQLLRITRELGEKMEGEEAREKDRQSAAYASENGELRAQLERYKDEMQATATQIDSYMKERDMFRRMLQHRGTIAADADTQALFGSSIIPATPQRNGVESDTRSRDVEDLNKLLKEQQKFFDQYRTESATDRRILKDQVDTLTRENSKLQVDVARSQSQITLAQDRFELLQGNYANARSENTELQKRSQLLSENAAKQDLRIQQVAEELVEARSFADSLRLENANVKAEKDLWKRIEARLTEENKELAEERNKLNKLTADLSNLANERERSENEARRRLQTHAETIENELTEVKRKLEEEVDNGKKVVARREYEDNQNRTRIDDLSKSLSFTREELAAAKTARDQLQSRVDEMRIELRAAEEKAVALQPRPTAGRSEPTDDISTEQRLMVQLSDARRDYELARAELDGAREQIEQYKTIAQTTEEELASFTQTSDQYREELDALLVQKDSKIVQFEQRIEDLTAELTATNSELSDLRTSHDNASQELTAHRAALESELAQLRDDAQRHIEEKQLYREDVKAQAEIATQAQQSYEAELVKHADAARSLQVTRQELSELRTQSASIRADAEAAKASLEQGQESWAEQKETLQREINDLNQRRNDVDTQNRLLHTQLATFSSELQALRSGRSGAQDDNGAAAADSSNLQEVINYLRREKEIVEVQHDMASQDSRRLKQQLDHANTKLEEIELKLQEERKNNAERASNEASTTKLAQTINELNLHRESSVTLRNEARQARERLEEKNQEVEHLRAELQPLQIRLGELEAEVEAKDEEIRLITGDRDHWRDRTQNIISKYDRVDPAELEDLRNRITAIEAEKEKVEAEQGSLREQLASAEERITTMTETNTNQVNRIKEQAKQKARDQNTVINDLKSELNAAKTEQKRLEEELELANASSAQPPLNAGLSSDEVAELQSRIAEADAQASVRAVEVETLQGRIQELEQQIQVLTAELAAAQSASNDEPGEITEDGEALTQAQQQLAEAQQEITRLRTERVAPVASEGNDTDAAAEAAKLRGEMEQQHASALQQVQEQAENKITTMRNNLKRQLQEARAAQMEEARAELLVQHSQEIQALKEEHEATIISLKQEHTAAIARLETALKKEENRVNSSGTTGSSVDGSSPMDLTDDQINELMKSNQRVRGIITNSVRKNVTKETTKLNETIAAKDAEIEELKKGTVTAATTTQDPAEVEALRAALEAARSEKEVAVKTATDNAEKKAKVQLSQRDMAQAKLKVVEVAAKDTPDRRVAEVWEEAKKARAAPKPAVPAQPSATPAVPAKTDDTAKDEAQSEADKLKARQARFGMANAASTTATGPRFGQPSALPESTTETGINPQAASFIPQATRGGASGIPTATRSTRAGSDELSIQGAAARNAGGNTRGNHAGRGRGSYNAGQKRHHEGGGEGNGKRVRP